LASDAQKARQPQWGYLGIGTGRGSKRVLTEAEADAKAIEKELAEADDRRRLREKRQEQIRRHVSKPRLAPGLTVDRIMAGR
jgi:hypothetical protein